MLLQSLLVNKLRLGNPFSGSSASPEARTEFHISTPGLEAGASRKLIPKPELGNENDEAQRLDERPGFG